MNKFNTMNIMKTKRKKPKFIVSTIFSLVGLVLVPTIIILIILSAQIKKNIINQNIIFENESAQLLTQNIEQELLYKSSKSSIFNDIELISFELMKQYNDTSKTILIVDEENKIIVSNNEGLVGSTYENTTSTNKYLIITKDIGITKWKLIKIINTKLFTQNIDRIFIAVYISILFIFSIYLSYSLFILVLIHIPYKQLLISMENLGKGNFKKKKFATYFYEDDCITNEFSLMSENLKNSQELIKKSYKKSLSREIEALAFQIKPRFIYNTIEMIEKLSKIEKNNETRLLSKALLTITKYNIDLTNNIVTIEREVENIKAYSYIMNVQLYRPIKFIFDVDEDLNKYYIPSLLIQPIIENSIKHAFKDTTIDPMISLSIKRAKDEIIISVSDNGIGVNKVKMSKLFDSESDSTYKNNTLSNIKNRLSEIYLGEASICVNNNNTSFFEIIIKIPVLKTINKI